MWWLALTGAVIAALALANAVARARAREQAALVAGLAAGLAHELGAPIETVRTACQGVREHPGDRETAELLRWVSEEQLPALERAVHELRRLACPELGGAVSLGAVAAAVIDELRAEPKWVGVRWSVTGHASPVAGDELLVARAARELLANAADACVATAAGEGEVTVDLVDRGRAGAELRVRDTGVGMAPRALRTALRGACRSGKRSTGFGFGVTLAHHVAAVHGGSLRASSRRGRGAVFTLALPRGDIRPGC